MGLDNDSRTLISSSIIVSRNEREDAISSGVVHKKIVSTDHDDNESQTCVVTIPLIKESRLLTNKQ